MGDNSDISDLECAFNLYQGSMLTSIHGLPVSFSHHSYFCLYHVRTTGVYFPLSVSASLCHWFIVSHFSSWRCFTSSGVSFISGEFLGCTPSKCTAWGREGTRRMVLSQCRFFYLERWITCEDLKTNTVYQRKCVVQSRKSAFQEQTLPSLECKRTSSKALRLQWLNVELSLSEGDLNKCKLHQDRTNPKPCVRFTSQS